MLEFFILIALQLVGPAATGTRAPAPRLVVDRIEGPVAVVEISHAGEARFVDVPVALLPEGAGEGAVLRFEQVAP